MSRLPKRQKEQIKEGKHVMSILTVLGMSEAGRFVQNAEADAAAIRVRAEADKYKALQV
jgi:hypothetical protein